MLSGEALVRKIGICTIVCVLLACIPAASQNSRRHGESCPVKTASGWRTYVDRLHGFCFSYPSTYAPVAKPWLEKYTHAPDKSALERLRKAAQEHRLLRRQSTQDTTASIIVSLEDRPFNLDSFVAGAPTGSKILPNQSNLARRRSITMVPAEAVWNIRTGIFLT